MVKTESIRYFGSGFILKHVLLTFGIFFALHLPLFGLEARHLTPAQAAALAVVANPVLKAARDAKTAAAAERLQAGLLPNPNITGSRDRVTGSVHDVRSETYSVGVDWEITKLLTLGSSLRTADARYAAAGLDLTWEEFQTANTARLEVLKYALAEKGLLVARKAEQDLAVNASQIRAAGVNETELTLAAAEAAAAQAKVARLAEEQAVEDERLALNAALGLPPEEKIVVLAETALKALRSQDLPDAAVLNLALEKTRPDLLALAMGQQSQDAKLRAAILGQFPTVSLGVQQARDTGDITTRGVTLTVAIPIFDRNQGAVAAEKASRQLLADEFIARVATAHSDVAKALADFRLIRRQLDATETALAARRRLAVALEKAFRENGVEAALVYTARADVTSSEGDLLKLETTLAETAAALALATGNELFAQP